ncbi:MAG: IclR family transcriptional regulator [Clostridiaceae bacterium]
MEGSTGSHVQVLDRALDLIELLATSEGGLGLAELSAATGLPKSTIHRILASYASRHYIEKDPDTSTYFLGHKFVEIASLYLNKIVLKTEAAPIMHEMASMFSAISYLGVVENTEVVYLERAEQFNSLRLYTQIGKREPLYCTALGKVLMAALPEEQFIHIAKHLTYKPYTPNSVTSFDAFAKEVQFAREHGYALDVEEHTVGSSCLAVPIFDYTRKVMAAMSISGRGLFDSFPIDYIYQQMNQASMELSKRMGYTQDSTNRK